MPEGGAYPPRDVDLERPSVARVYDYFLGGSTNWAVDREFGDRVLAEFPLARDMAVANRLFLHRLVRHLVVSRGVRQFVDIGSGVPTMGHAHQVADEVAPGAARVVYVDHDPVAVAHSRLLLEDHGDPERHAAVQADLRDPDDLWRRVLATGVIDTGQPIALLLIAVLHVQQPDPVTDRDIGPAVVARYRDLLPVGSYLALSHVTDDGVPPDAHARLARLKQLYDAAGNPVVWRSRAEITALFGDFEVVDPGLVWTPLWHPENSSASARTVTFASPNGSAVLAGVAVRR
ncbi:SAM-dependent methyltransferase [Umezawaea endophytica]|uniref:SAM-dependent methyltransferase n=1 Tax=Umezawaea endophytica TaxID=1654476 RepID=UPI0035585E1E